MPKHPLEQKTDLLNADKLKKNKNLWTCSIGSTSSFCCGRWGGGREEDKKGEWTAAGGVSNTVHEYWITWNDLIKIYSFGAIWRPLKFSNSS